MSSSSFPILTVADLPLARTFYEGLGFTQTYQVPPEGDAAFVTMARADATLGLAAAPAPGGDRYAYWLYVDDVDGTFDRLTRAGAPAVEPPADQPWGERVASVRDPDGNLVHVGAPA